MIKNFYHSVEVELMKKGYNMNNYNQYVPTWQNNYNIHIVKNNPKEITSITITNRNTMIIEFWSEKPLPRGREVQSLRRLSQEMAKTNKSFVVRKSHVLRAA